MSGPTEKPSYDPLRRRQAASFVHSRNLQRGSGQYFYPVRPVELRGICNIVTGVLTDDNNYNCEQIGRYWERLRRWWQ